MKTSGMGGKMAAELGLREGSEARGGWALCLCSGSLGIGFCRPWARRYLGAQAPPPFGRPGLTSLVI